MFRHLARIVLGKKDRRTRVLRIELLEDRRVLTVMADVVFLVDESVSAILSQDWLRDMIGGTSGVDATLRMTNDIDVRYGLVGYANDTLESYNNNPYARSHLADNEASGIFSTSDHVADIQAAINNLTADDGAEDGWDAIEQAIAEYPFRDGAVPVFVLVQDGSARIDINTTLVRDGVLAALASKNVLLNAMVIGMPGDLFDVSPYEANSGDFNNRRVLGVEADATDGSKDGQHDYILLDTSGTTPEITTDYDQTSSDALQISYNGSNTGVNGMVGTGKSIMIGTSLSGGIGPTAAGYRAVTVPYGFVDMSSGATVATHTQIPETFTFPFYGDNYMHFYVDEFGSILLGADHFPPEVDLSAPHLVDQQDIRPDYPMISPLLDNLFPATDGAIKWKKVDVDGDFAPDLVIQWTNFVYAGDAAPYDPTTFQAVLYSDGRIRFNYIDIDSRTDSGGLQVAAATGGISATVGIWRGVADSVTLPPGKFVPGPHSIFGSEGVSGAFRSDANDSYVRLAWDTGGAAWDLAAATDNDMEDALRDAFKTSLAAQINRQAAAGNVFHNDSVIHAINYGGGVLTIEGFSADPVTSNWLSTTSTIDTASSSVPFRPGSTTTKVSDVFKNVRKSTGPGVTLNLDPITVSNGTYVVELLFSPIPDGGSVGTFDVFLEGKLLLNDYNPATDHARIEADGSVWESQTAGTSGFGTLAGIVKRFEIDVTSNLNISLVPTPGSSAAPSIAGVRVLKSDAPRVIDVVLDGSAWARDPYSYAAIVPTGKQLAPIYTQGVNRIQVKFNRDVVLTGNEFTLIGSTQSNGVVDEPPEIVAADDFEYDDETFVATWFFDTPLGRDKYRIVLSTAVKDVAGNILDGDWANVLGPNESNNIRTPDNFADDLAGRTLLSGNGVAGGAFVFFFSLLPGDRDQDGIVESEDGTTGPIADVNGDGVGNQTDVDLIDGTVGPGLVSTSLPLRNRLGESTNRGDYVDDEIVGNVHSSDYLRWKVTYGEAILDADGSGDAVVNAADYTTYANQRHDYSGWYLGTLPASGSGAGEEIVQFDIAPRVINVTVSGSQSTHDPYSFTAVDGSGAQLLSVPVGGPDTIAIKFSEDVNVSADMLKLTGLYSGASPNLAEFSYDVGSQTATWRYGNLAANDMYLISLSDEITDVEGDRLDGEWTNPASIFTTNASVSEFPSGDGDGGGDFNFVITLLSGDYSLDNEVDSEDYDIFAASYANHEELEEIMFAIGDGNGDGMIDSGDFPAFMTTEGLDLRYVWMLADLDGDFDVDIDDRDTLFDNWENNLANPTHADGDLDDDGDLDGDDFDLLFSQYGLSLTLVS